MSATTHPADLDAPAASHAARRPPAAAIVAVIALVQVVLVMTFAWAASRATPKDLPLVVAGPAAATQGVIHGLEQAQPGVFDLSTRTDDAAARAAVRDRAAYGAIVLSPQGATVYVASAASPTVADLLTHGLPAALAAAQPAVPVTVTDLAPNPAGDPHGAALGLALLPILITSLVAGGALAAMTRRRSTRLGALLLFAVLTGVLATLALQTWLGVLGGSWLANASVLALAALAISAATAGLGVAGRIGGIAAAVVLFFFFGFPFSGATTAWQLMPAPWGQWAQFLPLGAANTAARSVAFFDGAGAGGPIIVLALWAVAGLALAALRARSSRRGEAAA